MFQLILMIVRLRAFPENFEQFWIISQIFGPVLDSGQNITQPTGLVAAEKGPSSTYNNFELEYGGFNTLDTFITKVI